MLLRLLTWEQNCYVLLASGLAAGLIQCLAAALDRYIATEGADKQLCKDCAAIDQLLQVEALSEMRSDKQLDTCLMLRCAPSQSCFRINRYERLKGSYASFVCYLWSTKRRRECEW